jgi:hypothetical protein
MVVLLKDGGISSKNIHAFLLVDPAEAESFVQRFSVGDAFPARRLLVETNEQFKLAIVVLFEPGAELFG